MGARERFEQAADLFVDRRCFAKGRLQARGSSRCGDVASSTAPEDWPAQP